MRKALNKFNLLIFPFAILILAVSAARNLGTAEFLSDRFHHGEYFASAVSFFSTEHADFIPLTIHGALDLFPAILAKYLWGLEQYFFPTLIIYKILEVFSTFILLLIVHAATKNHAGNMFFLIAVASVAPKLVGYRDLFLLASIYLFTLLMLINFNKLTKRTLEILYGICVAVGIFWSFDRGVAGALSLGLATLFLAYKNRTYFLSFASFFVSIIILKSFSDYFDFSAYFENIRFLINTSAQWWYGWNKETISLTACAFMANIAAIGIFFCMVSKTRQCKELVLFFSFSSIAVFMFKIGANRADLQHISMALWMPLIILAMASRLNSEIETSVRRLLYVLMLIFFTFAIYLKISQLRIIYGLAFFVVLLSSNPTFFTKSRDLAALLLILITVGILSANITKLIKQFERGEYRWILTFKNPKKNMDLTDESVKWAAQQLTNHKTKCVFDFSNSGLINGLANLPVCTIFTYPVYANSKYEGMLIDMVEKASPSAIIYSSTYWSYNIDEKSMANRFPTLDAYLKYAYPNEMCHSEYCVRFK